MAAALSNSAFFQSCSQLGGSLTEIIDSRTDLQSCSALTSSSHSPPRPTLLSRPHSITTITVAPAKSFVASKKRRRGRRRPDAGEGGGDDDGGPGNGGYWGGGDWDGSDDEGPNWSAKTQNIWMWQAICVCGLLQAVQYLASEQQRSGDHAQNQMVAFVQ